MTYVSIEEKAELPSSPLPLNPLPQNPKEDSTEEDIIKDEDREKKLKKG